MRNSQAVSRLLLSFKVRCPWSLGGTTLSDTRLVFSGRSPCKPLRGLRDIRGLRTRLGRRGPLFHRTKRFVRTAHIVRERHPVPFFEAVIRGQVASGVTQMPLADHDRAVPGALQHGRDGLLGLRQPVPSLEGAMTDER